LNSQPGFVFYFIRGLNMSKKIVGLFLCCIGSVFLILLLSLLSESAKHNPNGFVRMLPSHKITGINTFDIRFNSYYLAGSDVKYIYLANLTSPGKLLSIDMQLTDTIAIKLILDDSTRIFKGSFIAIDSPNIYLMDGVKPSVFEIKISNLNDVQKVSAPFFTAGTPISSGSFIFRSIDSSNENILLKKTVDSPFIKPAFGILEKQVDGIFCTDGTLIKVPQSPELIYVYYYRNQFICIDTNLNLLYRSKTIDTVSHAHISVASISSEHQVTLSSPPMFVNKQSCANKDWLFIHSALKADNETQAVLDAVSVIDVYLIKDGRYHFSFYVPDFRGKKMRDFKVYGNTLVALYDHYVYTYHLNF
jgi:hypothetical protein